MDKGNGLDMWDNCAVRMRGTHAQYRILCKNVLKRFLKSLSQPCYHRKIKKDRADRESNPGHLRDKQGYSTTVLSAPFRVDLPHNKVVSSTMFIIYFIKFNNGVILLLQNMFHDSPRTSKAVCRIGKA